MALLTGGCECGAIRYQAQEAPFDAGWCHCRICQRISGAPAQPWALFTVETFGYVKGEPRVYRSSSFGERRFCGDCGASIEFRLRENPTEISINIGTLDDPSLVPPRKHIWTRSQVSWFATADDLPTFLEYEPENGG
ncbi:GFA family protein [Labrys sp. KNU-23]|uniref:GFA family protein n=1 Tax=Labrys sp. KNU-23 TaxID=2789216 RepID=UPI0011ECFFB1|nr:GFA family protein [Labrys sp. KNU-23]QEN88876.1 GFA family protein [Labrys sp. KNU-23]